MSSQEWASSVSPSRNARSNACGLQTAFSVPHKMAAVHVPGASPHGYLRCGIWAWKGLSRAAVSALAVIESTGSDARLQAVERVVAPAALRLLALNAMGDQQLTGAMKRRLRMPSAKAQR